MKKKIIVSNTIRSYLKNEIKKDCIVRYNMAWATMANLQNFVESRHCWDYHGIFVDYPRERNKPSKNNPHIGELLNLISDHMDKNIYFGLSNVKTFDEYLNYCKQSGLNVIPKIENEIFTGIEPLKWFIDQCFANFVVPEFVVIDKEDLFVNTIDQRINHKSLLYDLKACLNSYNIPSYVIGGNVLC